MKTNDFSYFIERYLANEMGPDEKMWFEKEVDGNVALEKELLLRRKAELIIKSSDIMDLRYKLRSIEKTRADKESSRRIGTRAIINYAAIFTGLLFIGSIVYFSSTNLSKETIYKKYYKTYESVSATRSGVSEVTSLYSEAIGYYNNKEYQKAAQALEVLLKEDQGNMEYQFQLANSYMGGQKYPEAGSSYLKVIEDNNNLFIEDAKWYLGICYIMTDEMEKAKNQLRIISSSEGRYQKDAKKLLRRIK
jgi:tetratricopeptide (TPR) repeat protein